MTATNRRRESLADDSSPPALRERNLSTFNIIDSEWLPGLVLGDTSWMEVWHALMNKICWSKRFFRYILIYVQVASQDYVWLGVGRIRLLVSIFDRLFGLLLTIVVTW